jgi:hypothetical protein
LTIANDKIVAAWKASFSRSRPYARRQLGYRRLLRQRDLCFSAASISRLDFFIIRSVYHNRADPLQSSAGPKNRYDFTGEREPLSQRGAGSQQSAVA